MVEWENRMEISKRHYDLTLLGRVVVRWADHTRDIVRLNEEELQAVINQQQLLAEMRVRLSERTSYRLRTALEDAFDVNRTRCQTQATEKAMAELEAVETALAERRKAEASLFPASVISFFVVDLLTVARQLGW